MSKTIEVKVPDIGDFEEVEVIEVLVNEGDQISPEQSLITLESDKATMELPAEQGGRIKTLKVAVGDKVSEGTVIALMEVERTASESPQPQTETQPEPSPFSQPTTPSASGERPSTATVGVSTVESVELPGADIQAEVVVLGAGPGGYTAAFRAADLGKEVVLIERYPILGGVCLNVGCIPSKALLHTAQIINESRAMGTHGVSFAEPEIDLDALRAFKDKTVGRLTGGLKALAKQRKVTVVQGTAEFESEHLLNVSTDEGEKTIAFRYCIVAAGSRATQIPGFPHEDPRVWDSTDALELPFVPERMLIVGGGIIGLEMATVYHALGAKVTVVELMEQLIPGADADIVKPLHKIIAKRYENIFLKTKVASMQAEKDGTHVSFEGEQAPSADVFDAVLVSVGRQPNGKRIGADKAGIHVTERGFIPVDRQQRTNVPHIFAIGDVVGNPMLAHKATHEGKVAAEVIAGHKSFFDVLTIPSVAYTDPEVAWMGLSENEARERGIEYTKGAFPWAASGRSLGIGRDEGVTKLLFEKDTGRLIGAGMVGPNAGELVAETVLAMEMGADAEDIGLSIHPHPTLSETVAFAAEMAAGTITDLMPPRRR
jgi:dihydrolipoamide dehydrogenase